MGIVMRRHGSREVGRPRFSPIEDLLHARILAWPGVRPCVSDANDNAEIVLRNLFVDIKFDIKNRTFGSRFLALHRVSRLHRAQTGINSAFPSQQFSARESFCILVCWPAHWRK